MRGFVRFDRGHSGHCRPWLHQAFASVTEEASLLGGALQRLPRLGRNLRAYPKPPQFVLKSLVVGEITPFEPLEYGSVEWDCEECFYLGRVLCLRIESTTAQFRELDLTASNRL